MSSSSSASASSSSSAAAAPDSNVLTPERIAAINAYHAILAEIKLARELCEPTRTEIKKVGMALKAELRGTHADLLNRGIYVADTSRSRDGYVKLFNARTVQVQSRIDVANAHVLQALTALRTRLSNRSVHLDALVAELAKIDDTSHFEGETMHNIHAIDASMIQAWCDSDSPLDSFQPAYRLKCDEFVKVWLTAMEATTAYRICKTDLARHTNEMLVQSRHAAPIDVMYTSINPQSSHSNPDESNSGCTALANTISEWVTSIGRSDGYDHPVQWHTTYKRAGDELMVKDDIEDRRSEAIRVWRSRATVVPDLRYTLLPSAHQLLWTLMAERVYQASGFHVLKSHMEQALKADPDIWTTDGQVQRTTPFTWDCDGPHYIDTGDTDTNMMHAFRDYVADGDALDQQARLPTKRLLIGCNPKVNADRRLPVATIDMTAIDAPQVIAMNTEPTDAERRKRTFDDDAFVSKFKVDMPLVMILPMYGTAAMAISAQLRQQRTNVSLKGTTPVVRIKSSNREFVFGDFTSKISIAVLPLKSQAKIRAMSPIQLDAFKGAIALTNRQSKTELVDSMRRLNELKYNEYMPRNDVLQLIPYADAHRIFSDNADRLEHRETPFATMLGIMKNELRVCMWVCDADDEPQLVNDYQDSELISMITAANFRATSVIRRFYDIANGVKRDDLLIGDSTDGGILMQSMLSYHANKVSDTVASMRRAATAQQLVAHMNRELLPSEQESAVQYTRYREGSNAMMQSVVAPVAIQPSDYAATRSEALQQAAFAQGGSTIYAMLYGASAVRPSVMMSRRQLRDEAQELATAQRVQNAIDAAAASEADALSADLAAVAIRDAPYVYVRRRNPSIERDRAHSRVVFDGLTPGQQAVLRSTDIPGSIILRNNAILLARVEKERRAELQEQARLNRFVAKTKRRIERLNEQTHPANKRATRSDTSAAAASEQTRANASRRHTRASAAAASDGMDEAD